MAEKPGDKVKKFSSFLDQLKKAEPGKPPPAPAEIGEPAPKVTAEVVPQVSEEKLGAEAKPGIPCMSAEAKDILIATINSLPAC